MVKKVMLSHYAVIIQRKKIIPQTIAKTNCLIIFNFFISNKIRLKL